MFGRDMQTCVYQKSAHVTTRLDVFFSFRIEKMTRRHSFPMNASFDCLRTLIIIIAFVRRTIHPLCPHEEGSYRLDLPAIPPCFWLCAHTATHNHEIKACTNIFKLINLLFGLRH
jgi:hypothetical protein